MIRTVWLAAACSIVLGAMAAGKAAKTSATDEKTAAGGTIGADLDQEPLIKADRLAVTYVRQETPSQSTLLPMETIVPDVPTAISPTETKIISRHWHDPNATNSLAAKSKRTAKKGKSAADSRDSQAVDHSKSGEQTKHCDRTAAFSGLLRSLNLAPPCDS
jgi:hypothetical protein